MSTKQESAVDQATRDIARALQQLEVAAGRPVESISIDELDTTVIASAGTQRIRHVVIRMRDPYELSRWGDL